MAEYIAYVNVDHLRLGTEQSVTTTFVRCGFKRFTRNDVGSVLPAATLLFVGESPCSACQLAKDLEKTLRFDTMCDLHVFVFLSARLYPRRMSNTELSKCSPVSNYLN